MSVQDKKITVGLSGGVDSSVALILLKKQGWQPVGVSLKLPVWQDKRNILRENICCTKESLQRARHICKKLAVPYFIHNVRKDFQKKVVNYFISEFRNGRTPNPCIVCNRHLKFIKLFEFARKQGIKYVATGHYALLRPRGEVGLRPPNQKYQLLRPKDKNKDQTYFLSFLPQKWLSRIIFPLGDYTKKQVYQLAKKEGFNFFSQQKQSQDFCFVGRQSLPCFLQEKIGKKPGKIIDTKGQVLGKHQGLHFYTIGQRKGLNIPGGPYFVASLDRKRNLLIVARNRKEVAKKEVALGPFNFISGEPPKRKIIVRAKTRYSQPASKAVLYPPEKGKLKIVFDKPQFAITPGQFCVFYLPAKVGGTKAGQKDICLGAGVIN